jgi:site-specific DNA recombinase
MERNIRKIEPSSPKVPTKKCVAAYARVSSGKDAMLHSLSAQVSYYSDFIQKHRGWEYIGAYADEAMTGTKDNRAEFQRMLSDCRNGKIDMVITKSISRFARNTLTMLEVVRELKGLNVDVFFEKENIHSISGDGELMLTILASFAQEESRSVSENCKWRIRKRFEDGELVNLRFMYGYQISKSVIEINDPQAEVVRMIFNDYIEGMGCNLIAKKISNLGIPSLYGGVWSAQRIADIIKNEKYAGNSLLQKQYITDYLTKKLVRNKGELTKYYVENTHPSIIGIDTFRKAQEIMCERREHCAGKKEDGRYPFTGKIICGKCGKKYKRKVTHGRIYWNCSTCLQFGTSVCHTKQIPEGILLSITAEVLALNDFDETVFTRMIKEIQAPEINRLVFVFHDGRIVQKEWQNKSRTESWSVEAKQQARERRIEYIERMSNQ